MTARDRIVPIACGALAIGCLIGLMRVLAALGAQIPLDPNEGWNAYHAQAAMKGGALYPGAGAFLFNNYPPLSFYVVGAFGKLVGDNVVAGRIVSLLALFAAGLGLYAALQRMKVGRWNATFSVLCLVAGLLAFTDYVGMDDPQLLGHAIEVIGLVLLLQDPRRPPAVLGAALLMALACFVKHNLIALPLAATAWLAIHDRRNAVVFVVAGTLAAIAGLVAFHLVYGVGLLSQLASPRLYSPSTLAASVGFWLIWGALPLAAAIVLFRRNRDDSAVVFCALYLLSGLVAGTAFSGGAGVDANVWFDADIALSLAAGVALERLPRARTALVAAFVLPLLAGLAIAYDSDWLETGFWLHPFADETEGAHGDIAFLASHRGPALCEMMSLCYWAGKRAEVDVFNLGQAYASHARDEGPLIRRVEARYYAAVEFDSLADFALGPRVRKAFDRFYRVDHADDNGTFLVPR
jgi:hypothetical protein